jgi:succinate-acetate transporter protein
MTQDTDKVAAVLSHPWANPAPAGLGGLVVACFMFWAMLTGQVGEGHKLALGIWLLGAMVVQLAAGFIELRNGILTGGNLMLFFGAFFCVVGGCGNIATGILEATGSAYRLDPVIQGWGWVAATLFIFALLPCYVKANKVFFFVVIIAGVAVGMIAYMDITKTHDIASLAGWLLMLVGIGSLLNIAAAVINPTFGREIIKLGKPFVE